MSRTAHVINGLNINGNIRHTYIGTQKKSSFEFRVRVSESDPKLGIKELIFASPGLDTRIPGIDFSESRT